MLSVKVQLLMNLLTQPFLYRAQGTSWKRSRKNVKTGRWGRTYQISEVMVITQDLHKIKPVKIIAVEGGVLGKRLLAVNS